MSERDILRVRLHALSLTLEHDVFEMIEALERERDEARRFGEDVAQRYNELIARGPTLTCAFCGEEYPPGTPATQHERLAAHVRECSKHPLKIERDALRAEVDRLHRPDRRHAISVALGIEDESTTKQCLEIERLRAEVERLRAELQLRAIASHGCLARSLKDQNYRCGECAACVARAALESKEAERE